MKGATEDAGGSSGENQMAEPHYIWLISKFDNRSSINLSPPLSLFGDWL